MDKQLILVLQLIRSASGPTVKKRIDYWLKRLK